MGSNKNVKRRLVQLFGKECFIDKLQLREVTGIYTGKNQKKKIKQLTYHHIVEKQNGGQATIENGAVLSEENHSWFNKQPKEKQDEMNAKFQEYKIACLLGKLEGKGLMIDQIQEIEKDEEYIEIQLEANSIKDVIKLEISRAINSIETENLEDEIIRTEMLININKYLDKYEETRNIMNNFFKEKRDENERV